jgi:hypothetical protein
MELFICVDENGNTIDHPILGSNFREAFPHIDTENLPPEFAKFVRVPYPTLGVYEVLDNEISTYQQVNGVFTDVWAVRNMTDAEKLAKQQLVKDAFNDRPQVENWAAWVFDETLCKMQPPIPRPPQDAAKIAAGVFTFWCGAESGWKDSPPQPRDENTYEFDFIAWQWVQDTP